MKLLYNLCLIIMVLMGACAPARFVKPLAKGEIAANASLGGPLIGFAGTTIPIPFTSVGAGYGWDDKHTAFANLHTTALAFGVVQTELGVLRSIAQPEGFKPGVSAGVIGNLMADVWERNVRFYPELDVNAYWEYGKRNNFAYLGLANWFDLARNRAHGEKQFNQWILNLHAGHTFVRPKWSYTLEARYLAPFYSNESVVVDYKSFGNSGAVGLYFGIMRKF